MELKEIKLDQLAALKGERKFDAHVMYPGAPSEEVRARCESLVNELIETLMRGLPKQPDTSFVVSVFKSHLDRLGSEDTEEKERTCGYCENIMDILGIESSEGVLNNWLYGFGPNEEP
jgi:hypothetical protein